MGSRVEDSSGKVEMNLSILVSKVNTGDPVAFNTSFGRLLDKIGPCVVIELWWMVCRDVGACVFLPLIKRNLGCEIFEYHYLLFHVWKNIGTLCR